MTKFVGHCHGGKVKFEIETTLDYSARCNCSLCHRRGAVMHYVPEQNFTLIEGEDYVSLYEFHAHTAKHYFCRQCGIYPFHRPRTRPGHYGVNVGCLEGVDVFALEPELLSDGALME